MFWEIEREDQRELSLRLTVERLNPCKPEKVKKLEDFIDIAEL